MARASTALALVLAVVLALISVVHAARLAGSQRVAAKAGIADAASLVKPTKSGYLQVDKDGSALFYAFYESQAHFSEDEGEAPIVLWLQVRRSKAARQGMSADCQRPRFQHSLPLRPALSAAANFRVYTTLLAGQVPASPRQRAPPGPVPRSPPSRRPAPNCPRKPESACLPLAALIPQPPTPRASAGPRSAPHHPRRAAPAAPQPSAASTSWDPGRSRPT
jgi:hypothetical protein